MAFRRAFSSAAVSGRALTGVPGAYGEIGGVGGGRPRPPEPLTICDERGGGVGVPPGDATALPSWSAYFLRSIPFSSYADNGCAEDAANGGGAPAGGGGDPSELNRGSLTAGDTGYALEGGGAGCQGCCCIAPASCAS